MGLLSQATRAIFSKAPVKASIEEYRPINPPKEKNIVELQYWPESITDSKSASYDQKFSPGASHPIIQFQNGGAREISFSVMFTYEAEPPADSALGTAANLIGGLVTGKLNIGLSALGDRIDTNKEPLEKVMRRLRYFTYPVIGKDSVIKSPPLCLIKLPKSGIQSVLSANGNSAAFKDSFVGIMTQCNITYQTFHRTGEPRIVEVQLAFVETIQVGDSWSYVGADDILGTADTGKGGVAGAIGATAGALRKLVG